ncbi:MAG: MFS transporter [Chloroflexi bacterium]|nr:MFS transporter [Chloroflexota bacterium]
MQTNPTKDAPTIAPTTPNRLAVLFMMMTAFLSTMGIGIISPVLPFIVQPYLPNQDNLATIIGWLISLYAICQFIAAPGLGALSDRFGRRPLLLICLFGSAVGYALFGWGGALWVLFLSRMIDGLTGGNFSILAAYIGDVIAPEDRGRYFGTFGGAAGAGFIIGPVIGGFAARWGYQTPVYVAAALTLVNMLWGYFFLPESLSTEQRPKQIKVGQLNPLTQLWGVLALPQLRGLLLISFLYALPFAILQSTSAVLIKDSLGWNADGIGVVFLILGVMDIVVQAGLVNLLLPRLREVKVAMLGLLSLALGFGLYALLVYLPSPGLLFGAVILYGLGSGLIEPSLRGLLSQAAGPNEQGVVQGGGQSLQSLALVLGPLIGGLLYAQIGHASPYWLCALISGLTFLILWLIRPASQPMTEGVW